MSGSGKPWNWLGKPQKETPVNITEKFLEKAKATSERQTFRDDEITGFGVRIEPKESGGRKSFFYNVKLGGQAVFKALGEWPTLSVKDARDEAKEWAGKASAWKKAGYPAEANPFAKVKPQERTTVPTFKELTDAYIERHLMDPEVGALDKERARYDCELLIKNHFNPWLNLPIDKITTEHVLEAKNKAKGRYQQNSVVEFVRRVYNWAAGSKNGKVNFWAVPNPAKDIALNKPKPRKRFLQPRELLKFKEQLKKENHSDMRDVLTLLLATGARKGNVYAMRWENVSEELRNWHVPFSKSGDSGDSGDYEVALTPAAMEVLKRRGWKDQGFVFPANSRSGHISDIKKKWFEFRKRAGIPDVRLHDFRRTKGSYAALAGESLQKIAAMLGHKSVGSTEIYAQLRQESGRQTSAASDLTMEKMMEEARRRKKKEARRQNSPKLLAVAND